MALFRDLISNAASAFRSFLPTPISGHKRRRDGGESCDQQPSRKVQVSGQAQPAKNVDLPEGSAPAIAIAKEALVESSTPAAKAVPLPAPATSSNASLGFGMADRIRELGPRQSSQGGSQENKPQLQMNLADPDGQRQQQQQPAWGANGNGVAMDFSRPLQERAPTGEPAFPSRQPQPSLVQQQHQQQPRAAPPYAYNPAPVGSTPAPRQGCSNAMPTGYAVTPGCQQPLPPRQLFKTPVAVPSPVELRGFRQLRIDSTPQHNVRPIASTPHQPRPPAPAAAQPLGTRVHAPEPATQKGFLPQRPSFSQAFASGQRELEDQARKCNLTAEHLRLWIAERDAARQARNQPLLQPTREVYSQVLGDEEELVRDKGKEAQAANAALRSALKNLQRAVNLDPRVAAAETRSAATRAALAASQAAGGAEAAGSFERRKAAHEREVERLRREAEEGTRRKVEELKAADAASRLAAQQEQQRRQQQQQQPGGVPSSQASQSQAATAAPALQKSASAAPPPARPPAGAATAAARPGPVAAVARKPAAPPPDDDEVMDLVSSDEEEEEEGGEGEQEEEGEQGSEPLDDDGAGGDEDDPYGVEYGKYGNESRGGGNRALLHASRKERACWRRTMDRSAGGDSEILVSYSPNPITVINLPREKLWCMQPGRWLNDEVINLYMMLLQERDTRLRTAACGGAGGSSSSQGGGGQVAPRCHFFNSFFYNKLFLDQQRYEYKNVRRWTLANRLKANMQLSPGVLELDRIIIPINKANMHWTCAVVDLKEREVRYYDSLKGEDEELVAHLQQWVRDEAADKLKEDWDTQSWSVDFPKDIPEQRNGYDCGVFTIMFADRLGAGRPLDFSQEDMELLRVRVLARIMNTRVDL